MYYSNGNYEAFAKPRKPEGVDEKSAYLVGSGLASLAAACFLVRDGQMKGEKIHILEEAKLPGGACDGIKDSQKGFIIRGERKMENHFECLWDLFRSIPSLETEGASVLDEYYWLMSWTINRQPHFKDQPKDQLVVCVYGLFTNVPGNYIKKPMRECTGKEITEEWLYHLGVPEDQIEELASNSANCVPCMMPYITAFFMPRTAGDRPKVVPEGCRNFAFLGQFADTVRDTVFTTDGCKYCFKIRIKKSFWYDCRRIIRKV